MRDIISIPSSPLPLLLLHPFSSFLRGAYANTGTTVSIRRWILLPSIPSGTSVRSCPVRGTQHVGLDRQSIPARATEAGWSSR